MVGWAVGRLCFTSIGGVELGGKLFGWAAVRMQGLQWQGSGGTRGATPSTPPKPPHPRCLQRVEEGRRYYDFEFTAGNKNYTRHALASVTVGNGEGRGGWRSWKGDR